MINPGFEDRARQSGAEVAYVVKVSTRYCGLTFSQSPCPASGTPCYNTLATCPVRNSYQEQGRDYYFIQPGTGINPADGFVPFPVLDGPVSFSPGELDVSSGIGARSGCTFTLSDGPHHDIGVDPYVDTRDYDPIEQGTFWGRWLARNRFYTGFPVTVYVGHIDPDGSFDFDAAEQFAYVLERINGPSAGGKVAFQCKDPLKLADDDRALFPPSSSGQLVADIEETDTEFTIKSLESGFLSEYPDAGKVRIGDEILRFTRVGDTFTVVSEGGAVSTQGRGIDGTEAGSHRADSTVQVVEDLGPMSVPDLLTFFLVDVAGIDPVFIPSAIWAQVQTRIGFLFSTQISKPEGVKSLVDSLLKSAGVFMWWNDRQQRIDIRALEATPPMGSLELVDDGRFISGSFSIARDEQRRLSRVVYLRGLINSTAGLDDQVNYSTSLQQIDLERESLYQQSRTLEVYGRWTPTIAAAASWIVSGRTLSRYRDTPRKIKFALDNSQSRYWVGDILAVKDRNGQNADGSEQTIPIQITRAMFSGFGKVAYEALEYQVEEVDPFPGGTTIIIDQDTRDVRLRSLYEATIGPVDSEPTVVNVLVTENARVEGFPAIRGGFPEGWTVNVINNGIIGGRGGIGGKGGDALSDPEVAFGGNGLPGGNGGNAIEMFEDWTIVNNNSVYAGAGGGGGGGGTATTSVAVSGAGGGGGQSPILAPGGRAGEAFSPTSAVGGNGGDGGQVGPGTGGEGAEVPPLGSGAGGSGGAWATAGSSGEAAKNGDFNGIGGLGGQPGSAFVRNGYDLNLTDNGTIIGVTL